MNHLIRVEIAVSGNLTGSMFMADNSNRTNFDFKYVTLIKALF